MVISLDFTRGAAILAAWWVCSYTDAWYQSTWISRPLNYVECKVNHEYFEFSFSTNWNYSWISTGCWKTLKNKPQIFHIYLILSLGIYLSVGRGVPKPEINISVGNEEWHIASHTKTKVDRSSSRPSCEKHLRFNRESVLQCIPWWVWGSIVPRQSSGWTLSELPTLW